MRFFMPSSLFVLSILFGHKFQYFQIKSSYLQAIITMAGKIAISCKRKRKDKETVKEVPRRRCDLQVEYDFSVA